MRRQRRVEEKKRKDKERGMKAEKRGKQGSKGVRKEGGREGGIERVRNERTIKNKVA